MKNKTRTGKDKQSSDSRDKKESTAIDAIAKSLKEITPIVVKYLKESAEHYERLACIEERKAIALADIVEFVKTEDEWNTYKVSNQIEDDVNKMNYMKYGSIYGKKYCVKTDYGEWDSKFTMDILEQFVAEYYKKLRPNFECLRELHLNPQKLSLRLYSLLVDLNHR